MIQSSQELIVQQHVANPQDVDVKCGVSKLSVIGKVKVLYCMKISRFRG